MSRNTEILEYEELKKIVKNYHVTIVEESSLFELFQRKYGWTVEQIPITPSLSPIWKERLFIYFILFYGIHSKDYRKYSIESFLTLSRTAAIMPCIGLSSDKQSLKFLFLSTLPSTISSTPLLSNKTLKETIDDGRRVTIVNIVRWSQQLFRFLLYLHKNYITIQGNLQIEKVFLQSDTEPIQQMKEWLQIEQILKKKYKCKEEDLKPIEKVELVGRQIWIDFFSNPRPTTVKKKTLRSTLSPERTGSATGSPTHRSHDEPRPIQETMHLFGELRNIDLELKWQLAYKAVLNQEKEEHLTNLFLEFSQSYQQDLKAVGIILLQLLQRHTFNEKELKHWQTWNPITEDNKPPPPLTNRMANPAFISRVKTQDHGDNDSIKSFQTSNTKDGSVSVLSHSIAESGSQPTPNESNSQLTDIDVLTITEKQLATLVPDLKNMPHELMKLLAICFAPLTYPYHQLNHSKLHFTLLMRLPYIKLLNELTSSLEEMVITQEDDKQYVKESTWTKEDEEQRIQANKNRKKEMKKKAIEGVKNAVERVRQEKEGVWWSLQSTEFRVEAKKKRKAKLFTDAKFKERKDLIRKALFHRWNAAELELWLANAIRQYYQMICGYRDEAERNKPKKPEVYIHHIISEVFSPFDNFLISKIIGKYSYLFEEEEKQKMFKEAKAKEEEMKNNAFLRLASKTAMKTAPLMTSSFSPSPLPPTTMGTNTFQPVQGRVSISLKTSSQDDQASILSKSISEKVDFCYRAISSQFAKVLNRNTSAMILCKGIRKAIELEKEESLTLVGKTLIISEEQFFFKQLFLQTKYFLLHFPDMKYSMNLFYQGLQIVDRGRVKGMMTVLSQAILYQYHQDTAIRLKGEHLAASRLIAFFRFIYTKRVILPNKLAMLQERSKKFLDIQAEKERLAKLNEQLEEDERIKKSTTVHSIYDSYKTLPFHLQTKLPPEHPIHLRSLQATGNAIRCKIRFLLYPMTAEVRELINEQNLLAGNNHQTKKKKKISLDAYDFKKAFTEDRRQHLFDEWNQLTPVAYRITSHLPTTASSSPSKPSSAASVPTSTPSSSAKEEIVIYLKHSKQIYQEQYLKKRDFYEEQMHIVSTRQSQFLTNTISTDSIDPTNLTSAPPPPLSSSQNRGRKKPALQIRKYPVQIQTTPLISKQNPKSNDPEDDSIPVHSDQTKYANIMDVDLFIPNLPSLTSFHLSFEISSELAKDLYEFHHEFFALYPAKAADTEQQPAEDNENNDSPKAIAVKANAKVPAFQPILSETKDKLVYDLSPSPLDNTGIHLTVHQAMKTKAIFPSPPHYLQISLVYYSSNLHTTAKEGSFTRYLPITDKVLKGEINGEITLPSSEIINYQRINLYPNRIYELYYDIGRQYHPIQQCSALIQLYFLENMDDTKEHTNYEIQRQFVILSKKQEKSIIQNDDTESNQQQQQQDVIEILYEGPWKELSTTITPATPPYPMDVIANQEHPLTQEILTILTSFDYFTTDIFEEEISSIPTICHYISDHFTNIVMNQSNPAANPDRLKGLFDSSLEFGFFYRIRVKNSMGISKFLKMDSARHSIVLGKIYITQESLVTRGKLTKTLKITTDHLKKRSAVVGASSSSSSVGIAADSESKEEETKVLIPQRRANPFIMKQLLLHSLSSKHLEESKDNQIPLINPSSSSRGSVSHGSSPINQLHSSRSPSHSRKLSPLQHRIASPQKMKNHNNNHHVVEEEEGKKRVSSSRRKLQRNNNRVSLEEEEGISQLSRKDHDPTNDNPHSNWLKLLQINSPIIAPTIPSREKN